MTFAQRIALYVAAVGAALALVLGPIFGVDPLLHVKKVEPTTIHQACRKACRAAIIRALEGGGSHQPSTPSSPQQPGPPSGGPGGGDGPDNGGGPIDVEPEPGPPPEQPGLLDPVTQPVCDLTGVCL